MGSDKMKTHYFIDKEKIGPYLKILLTGLPTAMAVLLGQWLTSSNILLLFSLIILIIIFFVVSFLFLTRKWKVI